MSNLKSDSAKTSKIDSFFGIKKSGSSIRTEITAGIVTFLAMAYILTLNPALMLNLFTSEANLHLRSSVFIATALGAFIGTLLMALYAKLPLAQAPGLGLNSMVGAALGGSLIGGGIALSFSNAMLLVLISGVLFLLLSLLKVRGVSIREIIYRAIPESVRKAISVGIGLFIAIIGLVNAGIIVPGQNGADIPGLGAILFPGSGTVLTLAKFSSWDMAVVGGAIVCLFGFIIIAVLSHFKIKGAVIIGILAATLLGLIPGMGVTQWSGESWAFWEHFANFFSFNSAEGGTFFVAFTEGFNFAENVPIMSLVMIVITFCMIDMFDTMGTCVGCCQSAGLMTEDGVPVNYNRIMIADSVATCSGAFLGTSTVTTFVESGAGISAGGRTGLTALVTAGLFLLSIFLLPVFASIPGAAASSALIWVGCLMLKGVKELKLDTVKEFVPAFLTIAMMPFGYSITTGIGFGILSYVVIDLCEYIFGLIAYACSKKADKVKPVWSLHVVTIIIAILFLIYFFVPTSV
ncbi:MAG: NCS2 family permease [Clostridia bacterium]|nr:NCS2 family permease [Clostridia bacterium]